MNGPEQIHICEFEASSGLLDPVEVLLVVKSQDQIQRRHRMLGQLQRGKIGRIQPRPIAEGLLVKYQLPPTGTQHVHREGAAWVVPFREPRHVVPWARDRYLLTEISGVNLIDAQGQVLDRYTHPYFAFLHTVMLNLSQDRFLATSAGYDAILEIDVHTKAETWRWFGWDHGFNPNEFGIYYTNTQEKAQELKKQGYDATYIDPNAYNEQGLLTGTRTTHPNVAFYNPYTSEETVIVSLGSGKIIEIDRYTSEYALRLDAARPDDRVPPLLHGIMPYAQGWMVTNTCRGEFWVLDRDFNVVQQYIFRTLPGKPETVGEWDWLQLVVPISEGMFLGLDANRGMIVCDTIRRRYELFYPDPNWCLQDVLICTDASND
jgi:hypothetical protein